MISCSVILLHQPCRQEALPQQARACLMMRMRVLLMPPMGGWCTHRQTNPKRQIRYFNGGGRYTMLLHHCMRSVAQQSTVAPAKVTALPSRPDPAIQQQSRRHLPSASQTPSMMHLCQAHRNTDCLRLMYAPARVFARALPWGRSWCTQ